MARAARRHGPPFTRCSTIITMKLTGIADEAGNPIEVQIRAHQELGWDSIEMRNVEVIGVAKGNLHEIPDDAFNQVVAKLDEAGMGICGFGSIIGNWAHKITDDFQITLDEVNRALPRLQRLGTKLIRIMSYALLEDGRENDLPDQMKEERFRRLNVITKLFLDAGVTPVHENCMNYGGMSPAHALELLENVPGLKWVFDTGNPVFAADRSKPRPYPRQDAWEFYQAVKPHIAHVHVKDGTWNDDKQDCDYTMPGDGHGQVERIIADLAAGGYDGHISIEPHVAVVFHDADVGSDRDPGELAREQYDSYVAYGRRMQEIVDRATAATAS